MLTIKLRDIQGVHPEFSRIERDLDLAPVGVPDEAMSSTLEIIHKYHIISAQISAWEKPF